MNGSTYHYVIKRIEMPSQESSMLTHLCRKKVGGCPFCLVFRASGNVTAVDNVGVSNN
jgi:hypothetical protein